MASPSREGNFTVFAIFGPFQFDVTRGDILVARV